MIGLNNPMAGNIPPAKAGLELPDAVKNRPGDQDKAKASEGSDNSPKTKATGDTVSLGNSVQSKYDTPEQVLKNFDSNAVVDGIAGPLEKALQRAAAEGADESELESMREAAQKGIDQGFSQAQDILGGLGLMSDEVETMIGDTREVLRDRLDGLSVADLISQAEPIESSELRAGNMRSDQFEFSVTTASGDKVTISAAREESSALEIIQQQSESARELSAQWQGDWSESFSLTVDGDLNSEEMAAIESLMADVDKVADKFFSGRYEAAFNKAERLDLEGDALVSMSLNMTQKTASIAEYSAMASGNEAGAGRQATNDWIMPVKQYAQALGDLQRNQSGLLGDTAWLEALTAHPKSNEPMIDFAEAMSNRTNA